MAFITGFNQGYDESKRRRQALSRYISQPRVSIDMRVPEYDKPEPTPEPGPVTKTRLSLMQQEQVVPTETKSTDKYKSARKSIQSMQLRAMDAGNEDMIRRLSEIASRIDEAEIDGLDYNPAPEIWNVAVGIAGNKNQSAEQAEQATETKSLISAGKYTRTHVRDRAGREWNASTYYNKVLTPKEKAYQTLQEQLNSAQFMIDPKNPIHQRIMMENADEDGNVSPVATREQLVKALGGEAKARQELERARSAYAVAVDTWTLDDDEFQMLTHEHAKTSFIDSPKTTEEFIQAAKAPDKSLDLIDFMSALMGDYGDEERDYAYDILRKDGISPEEVCDSLSGFSPAAQAYITKFITEGNK